MASDIAAHNRNKVAPEPGDRPNEFDVPDILVGDSPAQIKEADHDKSSPELEIPPMAGRNSDSLAPL